MEISELKKICERIAELRGLIDALDNEKKIYNGEVTELKRKAIDELEKHELKNFDAGLIKISRTERRTVKVLDKYQFMDWLDGAGSLRDYLTVSVATASKIYNEHFEEAKDKKDVEFLQNGIPGLSEPNVFVDVRITKGKV